METYHQGGPGQLVAMDYPSQSKFWSGSGREVLCEGCPVFVYTHTSLLDSIGIGTTEQLGTVSAYICYICGLLIWRLNKQNRLSSRDEL